MGQTSQLHDFLHGEGRNFGRGGQYDAHPSCTLSRRERGEIDDPLLLRRRSTARLFTKWLYPTLLNFAHNGVCASVQSGFGAMTSRSFYPHLSCEGRQQSSKGLVDFPLPLRPINATNCPDSRVRVSGGNKGFPRCPKVRFLSANCMILQR